MDRDFKVEDGKWFPIMNEMAEKLTTYRLPGTEWQVLMMFLRKCYGFRKSSCELAWKEMKKYTRLSDGTLAKAIKKLKKRNIIKTFPQESKTTTTYKINSKLSSWKTLSYRKVLSYRNVNTFLQESTPIKDIIKNNIPPIVPQKKKPKKPKKRKTSPDIPWPADFVVTDAMREYAIKRGIDPEKVDLFFEDFKAWAEQGEKTYKNWEAAFRTRVLKAPELGKQFLIENGGRKNVLANLRKKYDRSGKVAQEGADRKTA